MPAEDWRQDFNANRPHRGLGMMTPQAFATGWITAHTAAARASNEPREESILAPSVAGPLTLQEPTIHQLSPEVVL